MQLNVSYCTLINDCNFFGKFISFNCRKCNKVTPDCSDKSITAFPFISLNSEFTQAMGFNSEIPVFHLSLLCFIILVEPIQFIIGIFSNRISRKMEYQADQLAANLGMGNNLIHALKKLSSMNYSNLTPHWIYVAVNYSHPPLLNRIIAIMSNTKD